MRKLFTLLCTMLLTAQFAVAQKNLYVISEAGKLTYYPATKVLFDNDLFTFTYGEVTSITKESFAASVNIELKSSEVKSFNQALEVGICFSDANTTPTIKDGRIKLGTKIGNYSFSISSLDAGTTYYYRAYVKINNDVSYGDVCNETTFGKAPSYTIINGHKFVDLGLPSGLLWATCNIGASVAAADGDYFAWGETTTKDTYEWSTYKYGSSYDNMTKYNSIDGKTVLDNEDDAAYVNWGTPCRMPTRTEIDELVSINNCTWTLTSCGYKIASKKNGNSIFLPTSGCHDESGLNNYGLVGYCWTSTLCNSLPCYAYYILFNNGGFFDYGSHFRCYGHTIRPVVEQRYMNFAKKLCFNT